MAGYTGIADVSKKIIEELQKILAPEIIPDGNKICLCRPEEKKDAILGIFLYDVQESEEIRRCGMNNIGSGQQIFPSIYLDLYYMITAYGSGDSKFSLIQEQQILGRVIQYFHDYPVLGLGRGAAGVEGSGDLRIQMLPLQTEDKTKMWDFASLPYRVSIFYKVSPLAIDSLRIKEVARVKQVDVNVQPMQE